jgi:hypothetical protein
MSALPFTDRELSRAWRELSDAATPGGERKNAHRLLMFYAVECGLKAIWLKRQNRTLFNKADIERTGHDLRVIVKELRLGSQYDLPEHYQLDPAKHGTTHLPRNGDISILHQAWRYGGQCITPNDITCESKLTALLSWIRKEIKS